MIRRAISEAQAPTRNKKKEANEDIPDKNTENDDDALNELVLLDAFKYDRQRKEAARELGVRVTVLDEKVAALRARQAEERAETTEPPDLEALAKTARDIIASKKVLDLFLQASDPGIAGERTLRKMLYLAGTSRLFERPMSVAIKGPSAAGKSWTRDYVLRFFPPEEVVAFIALSERALILLVLKEKSVGCALVLAGC